MKHYYFTNFFYKATRSTSSIFLINSAYKPTKLIFSIKPSPMQKFVLKKYFYSGLFLHFLNTFGGMPILFKKYCKNFVLFATNSYKKLYFSKYFYVGLGYKLFVFLNKLFVWVGLTHYSLVPLPPTVKIFPKKRRIYILANSLVEFSNLLTTIRRIRKMDIYKGKGLLEVKSYKGFIRMKSGKKKQY